MVKSTAQQSPVPGPKVSVVIATHNRCQSLPMAVRSMLDQTEANIEILIVDDQSTDATSAVIQELCATDPRVVALETETNLGPSGARNLAIRQARGAFVAIMDDDDVSVAHRLATQLECFAAEPQTGLVFSSVLWVDHDGRELGSWPGSVLSGKFPEEPREVLELLYLMSNKIPNPTVMVRTELLLDGLYDEDLRVGEDWLCFLKLAAQGVRFHAIRESLLRMNRDGEHEHLAKWNSSAFLQQRGVLKTFKIWAKQHNIQVPASLHRQAWSNQLSREARLVGGIKGLLLSHRSLVLTPWNRISWKGVASLYQKALWKLARLSGLSPSLAGSSAEQAIDRPPSQG